MDSYFICLWVEVKYLLQTVTIEQYNLDIEQWLSSCVESLLSTKQRFRLSQLVDYDVQLVEVCRVCVLSMAYCVF